MATLVNVEIVTIKGDEISVDRLVARRFKKYMPGYVERVLDSNQGLAGQGPLLGVGTQVKLPRPARAEEQAAIRVLKLWE